MSVEEKIDTLIKRFDSLETKFDSLETRVGSLETKVGSLEGGVKSLESRMKIEFEETRRVIGLGFERVDLLEESMGRRFDEVTGKLDDVKTLHEAAIVHVRKSVEKVEKPRRR
jgi:chromosome segregation ATPase